jgi:hypothetical protein
MARREWMIEKRKRLGLTRERMAHTIRKPGMWMCSEKLLTMLEEDDSMVTHPGVAEIIAENTERHRNRQKDCCRSTGACMIRSTSRTDTIW